MARPISAAPQASDNDNFPDQAQVPAQTDLPEMPDLGGASSLSAPGFPPLNLPDDAGPGIEIAMAEHPDMPDVFGL